MFRRALIKHVSHARVSASAATRHASSYIHPLTEAALQKLEALAPPWFVKDDVAIDAKDGTFSLRFTDQGGSQGQLRTYYDKDVRCHFLAVRYGALAGRVSLMDNSKSAWQSNVGDDLARVTTTVNELCARIEDASNGILPGDEGATPAVEKPSRSAAPAFPFPDNVRPPEG
jgi:hypothetical protein